MLASRIVWLDCLLTNVDRTARNTNMLTWNRELWLIDHGASLYFHHSWTNWQDHARRPFVQVKDHVLLPAASMLQEADREFKAILTDELIDAIVALIPDVWLQELRQEAGVAEHRKVYADFLKLRVSVSEIFVNEAEHARRTLI